MQLSKLINNIKMTKYNTIFDDLDIKNIKIDNREVEKGDLFIALKGKKFDGNDFVQDALNRGASIIVSEKKLNLPNSIQVENARNFYSLASKNFFDGCCDKMKIIAITGTNGKTTITNSVSQVLEYDGKKVGQIGTLGAKFDGNAFDTGFTTPDPYLLHKIFKQMYLKGCEYVVMEASAHAIELSKLDGITFDIAVLTNITEDHLDFFKTMQRYAYAKEKLFLSGNVKKAIVCIDNDYCRKIFKEINCPKISYGLSQDSNVYAGDVRKNFNGSIFDCEYFRNFFKVEVPLVGEYNIQNMLATIAVSKECGMTFDKIKSALYIIKQPEGRFNVIKFKNSNIVIDFAHTPDGLENILKTAKAVSKKKLVVIFGCGGNRDRKKRPIMGEIACKYADKVVLTSDNPRWEKPEEIIEEIKKGTTKKVEVIVNRKEAIERVLANCDNETIIIAGKGAEKYQEIQGVKYPYNDFDVVYEIKDREEEKH